MSSSIATTLRGKSATIGLFAFIIFTGMIIPIALFHELGHIVTCNAFGGTGIMKTISSGICFGDGKNIELMRFAGGAFGMTASLVPLVWWKKWKNDLWYRGVLVGMLALAVWECEKAMMETFSFEFYESDYGGAVMFIGAIVSAVILFFMLGRRQHSK